MNTQIINFAIAVADLEGGPWIPWTPFLEGSFKSYVRSLFDGFVSTYSLLAVSDI